MLILLAYVYNSMIKSISVIGSGSWATALVKVFADSGIPTSWLVRSAYHAEQIKQEGRNPRYLSYLDLDLNYIKPLTQFEEAIQNAQLVVFAVPSAYLSGTIEYIEPTWLEDKQVAVSIKGFVPGTATVPSKFVQTKAGLSTPVMVIGGPCHAEEIAMKRNTYVTVAGEDVNALCDSMKVKYIKAISNNDPTGVEYAAILKNIIGIATGIASGLNYGENFQAVLTSNAMREINNFLDEINPLQRDLYDSAYFGDTLVTAYSDYSRNRTLGKLIGRGIKVTHALQAMEMVAEGYYASKELAMLTRDLETVFPIIGSVYRILHGHANAFQEFKLIEKHLR